MQQIKGNTPSGQLCHISTTESPTNSAPKGENAAQVNSDVCWFQDPPFFLSMQMSMQMSMQSFQMVIKN